MKIAIVHDWLIGMRGGEKVLEQVCQLFPDAEIFTLFYIPENVSPIIRRHKVHTSLLQSLLNSISRALKYYRYLLPFYPLAVAQWKLDHFDMIVSISHCVAKGIKHSDNVPHICYCLTPMRYIWDNYESYFGPGRAPISVRSVMKLVRPYLKRWDVRANAGVDFFIAISQFVAQRIRRYYQREAEIIYPPVDTDFYHPLPSSKKENYYLIISALVPYKKIEIAVCAFNKLPDKKLKIVGVGPEFRRLKSLAQGNNIEFLGWLGAEELRQLYQGAKALLYCGEEDFGIVMAEAQACGTPVVAYARGGATEIVLNEHTGLLFGEQSPDSLIYALEQVERNYFTPEILRKNALRFSTEIFRQKFLNFIQQKTERIK